MMRVSFIICLAFSSFLTAQVVIDSYIFNLSGKPDAGYYLQLGIGTPATLFNVLIDTGSSNFAIAGYKDAYVSTYYQPTNSSTYTNSHESVSVRYTEGSWNGELCTDMLTFPEYKKLSTPVNIAVIKQSKDFFINASDWQGILGLGYSSIALSGGKTKPITVVDSFVEAGLIRDGFSLLLCGPQDDTLSDDVAVGGLFTLGSPNASHYSGQLMSSKIVQQGFYQVLLTDIRVKGESLDMACVDYNTDKTIVDSGTTNIKLPDRVFEKFIQVLKKKVEVNVKLDTNFWEGTNPICSNHTPSHEGHPFNVFPEVEFDIYAEEQKVLTILLTSQQYLRPIVYSDLPRKDCYKMAVARSKTGSVIGAVVMEGFYLFFDRVSSLVSFANTTCVPRFKNILQPMVKGYSLNSRATVSECMYRSTSASHLPAYVVVIITIACILFLVMVILFVRMMLTGLRKHRMLNDHNDDHDLVDDTFDTSY